MASRMRPTNPFASTRDLHVDPDVPAPRPYGEAADWSVPRDVQSRRESSPIPPKEDARRPDPHFAPEQQKQPLPSPPHRGSIGLAQPSEPQRYGSYEKDRRSPEHPGANVAPTALPFSQRLVEIDEEDLPTEATNQAIFPRTQPGLVARENDPAAPFQPQQQAGRGERDVYSAYPQYTPSLGLQRSQQPQQPQQQPTTGPAKGVSPQTPPAQIPDVHRRDRYSPEQQHSPRVVSQVPQQHTGPQEPRPQNHDSPAYDRARDSPWQPDHDVADGGASTYAPFRHQSYGPQRSDSSDWDRASESLSSVHTGTYASDPYDGLRHISPPVDSDRNASASMESWGIIDQHDDGSPTPRQGGNEDSQKTVPQNALFRDVLPLANFLSQPSDTTPLNTPPSTNSADVSVHQDEGPKHYDSKPNQPPPPHDAKGDKAGQAKPRKSIIEVKEVGLRSDDDKLREEKAQHANTKKRLEKMYAVVQKLNSDVQEKDDDLEEIKTEVYELKLKLSDVKDQLARKDAAMTSLEARYESGYSELQKDLRAKAEEAKSLKAENERLAREVERMKGGIQSIKSVLQAF